MLNIQVLPAHLVNKIAAGEVIERPASIVKELVENALDAGATRIDIVVEDGGKKLIAVTDNGEGMGSGDLALAFAPHATSKVATESDLAAIGTMGFRGEALASIASVSQAHIRTRKRDGAEDSGGWEIDASGEQTGEVRPCPAGPGTTVTVRNLFFNTPARRKFMRATGTELGHITEQLVRLGIPHRRVAFTLRHNGREVHNLPPVETTTARLGDLFSAELTEQLIPIAARRGRLSVTGLIASPSAARSSGRWQYFFLNGRFIRDRLLGHALREAYRGLLRPDLWPVAFIFLRMDPAEVDINVHPTKIEVRFREGQLVHGELLAALRETLNKANLTPDVSLGEPAVPERQGEGEQRRLSVRQALEDFFKSAPPPQRRLDFGTHTQPQAEQAQPTATRESPYPLPRTGIGFPVGREPPAAPPDAVQIHNTYIVAGEDDGLIIVDQHALHERLIYNDLKQRLGRGPLAAQRLLIPETLKVTAAEAATLGAHGELLVRLGIEISSFGPQSYAIQQFPAMLLEKGIGPGEFLREILDALAEDETTDSHRLLDDLLARLACKAAVKAGQALSREEIDELLTRRHEAEKSSACPHGRPTTLKLTRKDLERQFKRI